MTDPTITTWRGSLSTLASELFDLEANPTVELARSGCLTGTSATTWTEADKGVALAWDTFRAVDDILDRCEADPTRITELLTASTVPSPEGTKDPTAAMLAAREAVARASEVAARLTAAWDDLATRTQAAQAQATAAGDTATAKAADALGRLLGSDPLAVTEADLAPIEARAQASGQRQATAQSAVARLDLDLEAARTTLATLDADVQKGTVELDHAASRIAGLATTRLVPDLAALGDWLDRIAVTAEQDPPRAATDLAAWTAAAQARRSELDAALAPARDGLRRRDQGQGLWKALRAKAGARRLDEQAEVAAALTSAQDLLWQAPCDLAAAEAALSRLAALLDPQRAPGDRT